MNISTPQMKEPVVPNVVRGVSVSLLVITSAYLGVNAAIVAVLTKEEVESTDAIAVAFTRKVQ